jgi:hypothetical protein
LLPFAGGTYDTSDFAALHGPSSHAGKGAHAEQKGKVRPAEPVSLGLQSLIRRWRIAAENGPFPTLPKTLRQIMTPENILISLRRRPRSCQRPVQNEVCLDYPSLCVVALLTLPPLHLTQPSVPRRVNVPFAENIFHSAFSGSTANSSPHAYRPFSTTSAISSASLTHTLRHTHRTSAISVGTLDESTQSFMGICSYNRIAGPSRLGVPPCRPATAQQRSLYASRKPSAPSSVGERRGTWHSAL